MPGEVQLSPAFLSSPPEEGGGFQDEVLEWGPTIRQSLKGQCQEW